MVSSSKKIILKLEWLGLPVPNRIFLYNRIGFLQRTVTKTSSKFSTKDLRDWAETLSCTIEEDAPLVIGQNVEDNIGEDGVHNFQVIVSTRMLVNVFEQVNDHCMWMAHTSSLGRGFWS